MQPQPQVLIRHYVSVQILGLKSNSAVPLRAMPWHFPLNLTLPCLLPSLTSHLVSPQESIERLHKIELKVHKHKTQHGGRNAMSKK